MSDPARARLAVAHTALDRIVKANLGNITARKPKLLEVRLCRAPHLNSDVTRAGFTGVRKHPKDGPCLRESGGDGIVNGSRTVTRASGGGA
ncbi:hypothetical protein GCM10008966_10870 [Rhodovulum strictum]